MDIIKALSSKGSATSSPGKHFVPERKEIWSLQYMKSHVRMMSWTELDGEKYKENTVSLTLAKKNPIYRMIYLMNAIKTLREYHLQLLSQMKIAQRTARETGHVYDEEFPRSLRDFMWEDEQMNSLLYSELGDLPSLQTNSDLISQLIGLRVMLD